MMYYSLDRHTGSTVSDMAHIRQSVNDILSTPVGSRVMRRTYGSLCASLIDIPTGPTLQMQLMAAIYGALSQWEPRITLQSMTLSRTDNGIRVDLVAVRNDTADTVTLSVHPGDPHANR
ncbi:GPW/gp25 family protein [Salmonella enterica]|uniref:Baseplate assembly protein n=1 Tax=Salmonella enterica I TaxID=59201 RepID=A0A5U3ER30_SALET|nr:baseplate assembly protein [Salmonella enterica subsp. diarizonae]EBP3998747.1 baseplate assembly protein [Salmonella enterica subsp. enterica]ELB6470213.1 GPW/gp25 family protein [Salmonella enterica]